MPVALNPGKAAPQACLRGKTDFVILLPSQFFPGLP